MGNQQLKAPLTKNHKKARHNRQQQLPSTSSDEKQQLANDLENGDQETGCLSKVESLVKASATAAVPTARIRVHHTTNMNGDEYSSPKFSSNAYKPMVSPLTQFQKNLLREAWQRISKKGTSSIGTQIVRRMFNADQSLKRVFHHVTVIEGVFSFGLAPNQASQHHSEMFTDILSEAIENLDDLSVIIPKLNEYGARHAPYRGYGFKAEFWDVFGEAMIGAAREWEGWCKHRETLRGWTLLISFIVDRMRQGYEQAVKRPLGLTHQHSQARPSPSHRGGSMDGTTTTSSSAATSPPPPQSQLAATGQSSTSPTGNGKSPHHTPPETPPLLTPSAYGDIEGAEETADSAKNPSIKRSLPAKPFPKRMSVMSRDSRHHNNHNDWHLHDMQKLTISRDPRLPQQRSVGYAEDSQDRRLTNDGEHGDRTYSDRTSGTSLRYCNMYLMHSDTDLHNLSESLSDEKF